MTLDELRRDPRPLVTVSAAAEVFGFARSTLYDALRRGEFPIRPIRIGRRIYLSKGALLALLDGTPDADEEDRAAAPAEA